MAFLSVSNSTMDKEMNIWDLAKSIGGEFIKDAVPMGGLIVQAVNAMLPQSEQLGANPTGHDVKSAIAKMTPDAQAKLMQKQYDVDITSIQERHSTARAMLQAESVSTHTTRPKIALGAFYVVATIAMLITLGWLYAVVTHDTKLVNEIVAGWAFVGVITAPFVAWLNRYFGILKEEHKTRLSLAAGKAEIPPIVRALL